MELITCVNVYPLSTIYRCSPCDKALSACSNGGSGGEGQNGCEGGLKLPSALWKTLICLLGWVRVLDLHSVLSPCFAHSAVMLQICCDSSISKIFSVKLFQSCVVLEFSVKGSAVVSELFNERDPLQSSLLILFSWLPFDVGTCSHRNRW